MLLTSAAQDSPKFISTGSRRVAARLVRALMGGLPIELLLPDSKTRGRFYGKSGSHAIILALPNLPYSFFYVSVIPRTKEGVGCVEGARLRSQGEGWKDPAEQARLEMCQP